MPFVKPLRKTIWANINKPTEDMLKVRAIQMGVSKEELIGFILTDWCKKAHTKSGEFNEVREQLT